MSKDNNDSPPQTSSSIRAFPVRFGEAFFRSLDNHVHALKNMHRKRVTKQSWIEEAIHEKLKREKDQSPESLGQEKKVILRLDPDTHQAIDKQVETLKKLRVSYSKAKWIFEAVIEKMKQEERAVWKWGEGSWLDTLTDSTSSSHAEQSVKEEDHVPTKHS